MIYVGSVGKWKIIIEVMIIIAIILFFGNIIEYYKKLKK